MTVAVEPGVVLDQLNAWLKPHGLWFPVDVSTSAQATLGGMAGNNSCGSRSIAYGNMVHNVLAIDAMLSDGTEARFGPEREMAAAPPRVARAPARLRAIGERERARSSATCRRSCAASAATTSTSAARRASGPTRRRQRQLRPSAGRQRRHARLVARAHAEARAAAGAPDARRRQFPDALQGDGEARGTSSALAPSAVELVDRTMIDLARGNPGVPRRHRARADRRAGRDPARRVHRRDARRAARAACGELVELMGELGLPGSVVEMTDAGAQKALWEVRKAGLNIMMSMKGDGKPVSFIEDCAVPLEHLAEYVDRLTQVFARHGTRGTWYAHASVGTLHVRPILDMRRDGAAKMRAIAEEASAMVREYKGAFSGEHGDGLVRSEWVGWQFGPRLTRAFEEIKDLFDPAGLMNPGKIVRATKMDDASLFRFPPGYRDAGRSTTALDWSAWNVQNDAVDRRVERAGTGGDPAGGFGKAVEMCNNNGHCRKFDAGTMCPSYRVTRDEEHLTRGRANTLRLALSGQFGADGLASEPVREALDLCVSCKGCRRECPTGVDMAKMKIEALHQPAARARAAVARPPGRPPAALGAVGGARAVARQSARHAARRGEALRGVARLLGAALAARVAARHVPAHAPSAARRRRAASADVVLFVDTFTNYFEPENARAAVSVLRAAGYRVHVARADRRRCASRRGRCAAAAPISPRAWSTRRRPKRAAWSPRCRRTSSAAPPIVGLEPSCLLSLRDEFLVMGLGEAARRLAEQRVPRSRSSSRASIAPGASRCRSRALPQKRALLHAHCHQKAFDAVVRDAGGAGPRPRPRGRAGRDRAAAAWRGASATMPRTTTCRCGWPSSSLLPAVRAAAPDTLIVADGTSCRHQIADLTRGPGAREAIHVVRVLERALASALNRRHAVLRQDARLREWPGRLSPMPALPGQAQPAVRACSSWRAPSPSPRTPPIRPRCCASRSSTSTRSTRSSTPTIRRSRSSWRSSSRCTNGTTCRRRRSSRRSRPPRRRRSPTAAACGRSG